MNTTTITTYLRTHLTFKTLYLLSLGQFVSLILASMSFTSSLIAALGVDAPVTQTTFTYVSLALIYGSVLLHRRQSLQVGWYWYLLLGFVDVEGNYLVNKAYQYSSLTSVTLLDCFTIAWAIILTRYFLGTRYSLWQLFGAVLCVLGLCLVLLSDAGIGGSDGSRPLLGDFLVIVGTVFFAMSNVGEEFFVKKKDRVEVLSMMGAFGFIVSLLQLYPFSLIVFITRCFLCFLALIVYVRSILELENIKSIKWSADLILAIVGYTISSFMFYTLAPFILKFGGATIFNLSLLTSDMWAVVLRICFYKQQVDWLYYVAFLVVVIGLVIYSTTEKVENRVEDCSGGNSQVEYQVLDQENVAP